MSQQSWNQGQPVQWELEPRKNSPAARASAQGRRRREITLASPNLPPPGSHQGLQWLNSVRSHQTQDFGKPQPL